MEKFFTDAEQKIQYEKEKCLENIPDEYKEVVANQYDLLFGEMIKAIKENPEFGEQIIQPHKCWERCYSYMEKKARNLVNKNAKCAVVDSVTLMQWIFEYYALDDKLEVEEAEKKAVKEKELAEKENLSIPQNVKVLVPKPVGITGKAGKKDISGQMDLFSMFG